MEGEKPPQFKVVQRLLRGVEDRGAQIFHLFGHVGVAAADALQVLVMAHGAAGQVGLAQLAGEESGAVAGFGKADVEFESPFEGGQSGLVFARSFARSTQVIIKSGVFGKEFEGVLELIGGQSETVGSQVDFAQAAVDFGFFGRQGMGLEQILFSFGVLAQLGVNTPQVQVGQGSVGLQPGDVAQGFDGQGVASLGRVRGGSQVVEFHRGGVQDQAGLADFGRFQKEALLQ